jgi:hypothetical protein
LASPVLAHLSGSAGGPLDIIAAGDDRHLYAWQPSRRRLRGSAVSGFPVLVADPDKLTAVDPATNHLTFSTSRASADPGIDEDQGKIVDTPGVARLGGPRSKPSIILGTNEEYAVNTGDEGPINAGATTSASLLAIGATGLLKFANGRLYVIRSSGGRMTCSGGSCHSNAFMSGWPTKVGIIDRGLLPDVGEGIDGSPVIAPVTCPTGGSGLKIGVIPDAGPSYIFNPSGSSCYGSDPQGRDNPLQTDFTVGAGAYDHPEYSAVGYPAFGSLDGKNITFFAPETGLIRALDVVAPDYQGGQDFIGAWNTANAQQRLGFPAPVNDLQFLTGQVVGDVTGGSGQEVLGGSSSLDLQAFNAHGLPASGAWPKLTGDWVVATPALGSFGTLDTSRSARKDVVSITRMGTVSVYGTPARACSPSSSPRFHHDNWNSGNYLTDAVDPGKPFEVRVRGTAMSFRAPGGDLMCGKAARYQLVTSNRPITAQNFSRARRLSGVPTPRSPGARQSLRLPAGAERYVALRAVDAAGNIGLPTVVKVSGARSARRRGHRQRPVPGFTGAADKP